ncbi:MAG: cytochrome-c peroxidase [Bacteroidetes bacterium]|nr:cytochrome-c peroxidase [Bacteroidota bacterium]
MWNKHRIFLVIGCLCLSVLMSLSSCSPDPPPVVIGSGGSNGGDGDTTLISVSELPSLRIPADNPLTVAGVDLGRHLFYDKILSGDQTQACGSCHLQKFAFSDGNKFSKGIRGDLGTRNAMVLFNLMWSDSFFWDSRAPSLRALATMPIENPVEMDARVEDVLVRLNNSAFYKEKFKKAFNIDVIDKEHLSMAIEQFLLTLTSDNSRFDQFNRGELELTDAELRGFEKLKVKGCFACHSTSLMHDDLSHNTGLDKFPQDLGKGATTMKSTDDYKFKTPSLRNVMISSPYMHDGRFSTIEEVINFYEVDANLTSRNASADLLQVAKRNRLTPSELADVKAFLNALTDQKLITNSKYSDPF